MGIDVQFASLIIGPQSPDLVIPLHAHGFYIIGFQVGRFSMQVAVVAAQYKGIELLLRIFVFSKRHRYAGAGASRRGRYSGRRRR